MKKKLFIDTCSLLLLIDDKNKDSSKVSDLLKKCYEEGYSLITTDYVLDEFMTLARCKKKIPVKPLIAFIKSLYDSDVKVFGISEGLFVDALGLMMKYSDHYFSMTDCISFTFMKELGIRDVVTLDKHFTIAGFNNLLE